MALASEIVALRAGKTITFEGAELRMVKGKEDGSLLVPGDLYFGKRNSATVSIVRALDGAAVYAEDWAYAYNFGECVGVEFV